MLAPVEPQPAQVFLDGVDELLLLPGGVGVVEAQVTASPEIGRHPEVDGRGLGVAYVQVAVGLGREAGHHFAVVAAVAQVFGDRGADEVPGAGVVSCGRVGCGVGHGIGTVPAD